ncbi:MAG: hypothetical protein DRP85_01820 [Candidatus Makaraimicrobium thalassicum]|nr:MAG: hypothetical protein DRP85_01820 [Candidatus Omnitrophota bacterium]
MILMVKLISIAVILYGCLIILRPDTLKRIFEFVKKENRVYIAGGIKAVIGIFLMLASSSCRVPWIVLFLGALSVFGGIAGFLIKKSAIIRIIEWWETRPGRDIALMGTIALLVGVLLALAA